MQIVTQQDLDYLMKLPFDWESLRESTILVTGATGLIGSMTCRVLSLISDKKNLNIRILAMARNKEKATSLLSDILSGQKIVFVEHDITYPITLQEKANYIIHAACPTASSFFITKPVETIQTIVAGTMNVLDYARKSESLSVLYLSSMEAYGRIENENLLKPEDLGYINTRSPRSCYPEGKRMAENLCIAYLTEYYVPVKIIRLAQTFGPGISEDDERVFAHFLRSILKGQDIVMYTEGGSKHMYLDTIDAVGACLTVLFHGENGQIYNAGNPETYCSIRQMAEMLVSEFGKGESKILIDRSKDQGQYPADCMLFMDVSSLLKLGWQARYNLKNMYLRMMKSGKWEDN